MKKIYTTILFALICIFSKAQYVSALASGLNSSVQCLTVYQSELYVGGYFTGAVGGPASAGVIKWNDTAWSAVGSGISGTVLSLAEYDNELYAAIAANAFAYESAVVKYNGSSWDTIANMQGGLVRVLKVYNGELYAGGGFYDINGSPIYNIAKWNGVYWSGIAGLSDVIYGEVYDLCASGSILYLAGTSFSATSSNDVAAQWDGTSYTPLENGMAIPSGSTRMGLTLTLFNNELYLGGEFTLIPGTSTSYIAKWNGSTWSNVGAGLNNMVFSLGVYNNDLFAGGYMTTPIGSGVYSKYIAKWNGSAWSSVTTTNDASIAFCEYKYSLYFGGLFTQIAGGYTTNFIAKWHEEGVWPGDANYDKIADNYDLLPIGLYYGQTGTARASISNTWQKFVTADWPDHQLEGQNLKHADCNGDGTIDSNDTIAIQLNYNDIHALQPPVAQLHRTSNPDLYFVTSASSYQPGDWVDAEIWLGNLSNPAQQLYGIAFDLNYESNLIEPGTESISYSGTWLGTPGLNALQLTHIDAAHNTASGSFTRIDHNNVTGFGKIANFRFQIKNTLTLADTLHLSFLKYVANDSSGAHLSFNTVNSSIGIDLSTGISKADKMEGMTIAPNPFSTQSTITINSEIPHTAIELTDETGKVVRSFHTTENVIILEKGNLKKGVYQVQIWNTNKIFETKKIIIQ